MAAETRFETVADLFPWLEARGADELRGWLVEALGENRSLFVKLVRQAQREMGLAPDFTALKARMVRAAAPPRGGYVDWRMVGEYCRGLDRACLDPLEALLEEGYAAEVVELAEFALSVTEKAIEHVDDSGQFSMIWDELRKLHLTACQKAKPDGVELARRLFRFILSSSWDNFPNVVQDYREFFGEAGMAEFKRLAEERFARLPFLKPYDHEPSFSGNPRSSLTDLCYSIAASEKDVGGMVRVLMRDQSQAYRFEKIALLLAEHGHPAEAITWAEEGIKRFPRGQSLDALLKLLVELYESAGRQPEALRVLWRHYQEEPDEKRYAALKTCAEKAGAWNIWRERALKYRPG